ncbi:tyrosine-type recombinase/integrase [Streptomyces sp. NPDC018055]|uniref:tyrosine-type recombinase/integrase n=1 Tax=Streptomyces sp. NPDC018055 TaxID=3365038 RepID=UPI0037A556DD
MTTDLVVAPAGTLVRPEDVDFVRRQCEEIERQWLLEFKVDNTKRAYRRCADNWFDWCFDNSVSPLAARREHSAQWAADLNEVLAASSVNQALSAMNSWYEFGLDEYEHAYEIKRTPWRKKHRVDVSDESQTLGLDKAEAIAVQAVSWEYGVFDAAVVEGLLGIGLRSGELEKARVESYRTERGHQVIDVVRKRNKLQTLVAPPPFARALDLHLVQRRRRGRVRPTDPLIVCLDGQPLTNRRVATVVQRACRAARVKVISPHGLRHTCATLLLDSGVALRHVQRILGHADPRTTNRYDLGRHDLDSSAIYTLAKFLVAKDNEMIDHSDGRTF